MQLIELRCDLCFKVQFTLALMTTPRPPLHHSISLPAPWGHTHVCWGQLKRAAACIKIQDTQCA